MAGLTEDDVREWLAAKNDVLERAKGEIQKQVEFFIADWSNTWQFSVEQIENVRIKDAPRLHAKALRRELTEAEQLLERCYSKDDRLRFPVHDLLGIRVLVLSLNDVAAVRKAVEDLLAGGQGEIYPLGNAEDVDVEDINVNPRASGYRALHIDGSVTVRVGDTDYVVPFEVQVKTLAQHIYGQHTHDDAYVPDDANEDPRYNEVKGLQKALAEALNAADLLLAQIDKVAGAIRDDIARRAAGPDLTAASVANAVRQKTGEVVRDHDATRWAEQARAAGMTASQDFAALIDPSGDQAAGYAAGFQDRQGRRPATRELIDGLLGELDAGEPGTELEEGPQETASLEDRLAEAPPTNELDQLDPQADVVEPAEVPDEDPS